MKNSKSKKSNTGWKGIYFHKRNGTFQAQVTYVSKFNKDTTSFYVGSFLTLRDAIKAREDFIKNLF